jgi:hypothetical protein
MFGALFGVFGDYDTNKGLDKSWGKQLDRR